MALSIHETKEQILGKHFLSQPSPPLSPPMLLANTHVLANAYHLYPSHKYQNIILGTNGPLLPIRQYHAYLVANICDDLHCKVSQHCSATSSMLVTGLDSDTIGGAYTNLLDAMMCRCWKGHGQPHGDVQHIPGHGVQGPHGPSAISGLSSIGTAVASAGGNLGSAQRTASSSRLFGSGQSATGSALFGSGQRPQSIVDTFPTTDLSQGGQDNGVQTNGVHSGVNQNSGIHKHNGKNNHRPTPYGGRIKGCEKVDCEVCSYLDDDLAQDAQNDDPYDPRVRGQGGHGRRSSTGLTFGTAVRESMDSLKGSTGITFGTAAKSMNKHMSRTDVTFGATAKKSTDGFKPSPGFSFGTTAKTPTDSPKPRPFSFGYAEKSTDAPKDSTGIVYTGFKPSTQNRSVTGRGSTGSRPFRFNDGSREYPSPNLLNSGDPLNSILFDLYIPN